MTISRVRTPPADIRLVDLPTSLDLQVDADQLRRIVYNLLENAERHARRDDAALIIRLAAGRTDAGEVWLDVADNGPGMPDHVAEHLMEPFFTTDSNGTGLGLYVTRDTLAKATSPASASPRCGPVRAFASWFARPDLLGPALSSAAHVEAAG